MYMAIVSDPLQPVGMRRSPAAAGKPFKLAKACIRKLLTILNLMIRDGKTWNPLAPDF
jgi:hypothetical protein